MVTPLLTASCRRTRPSVATSSDLLVSVCETWWMWRGRSVCCSSHIKTRWSIVSFARTERRCGYKDFEKLIARRETTQTRWRNLSSQLDAGQFMQRYITPEINEE